MAMLRGDSDGGKKPYPIGSLVFSNLFKDSSIQNPVLDQPKTNTQDSLYSDGKDMFNIMQETADFAHLLSSNGKPSGEQHKILVDQLMTYMDSGNSYVDHIKYGDYQIIPFSDQIVVAGNGKETSFSNSNDAVYYLLEEQLKKDLMEAKKAQKKADKLGSWFGWLRPDNLVPYDDIASAGLKIAGKEVADIALEGVSTLKNANDAHEIVTICTLSSI